MRVTYKKGTNQYKKRLTRMQQTKAVIFLLVVFTGLLLTYRAHNFRTAYVSALEPLTESQKAEVLGRQLPTTTPTPSATPTPSELESIVAYITRVFEKEGKAVVQQALQVAFCESGWRTDAYNFNTNNTGDFNLFQINSVHEKTRGTQWKHDWKANVNTAYQIYSEQGWQPWVCARKLGIVK